MRRSGAAIDSAGAALEAGLSGMQRTCSLGVVGGETESECFSESTLQELINH